LKYAKKINIDLDGKEIDQFEILMQNEWVYKLRRQTN
jgi:hypothetical protein